MSNHNTDIIIIGGGIAGCIAAITLSKTFQVTLIDKLLVPKERIGESLAPAAQRIFDKLDLLKELEEQSGVVYIKNIGMQSCWGSDQLHVTDHLRNPDGFVKSLDRKSFESYLRKSAERHGVKCIWGKTLHRSSYKNEKWQMQIKANEKSVELNKIAAQFVIDASGRQSYFARGLGIKRQIEDKLIACWVTLPNTIENTMSTISASNNGWWYSAVVPKNKRIIAFHTDADLIKKQDLKTKESFIELAKENKQIYDLINGSEASLRFQGVVAANSSKLRQVAGQNWVAIGDAAISFDPLSSQGMFNAMASAMQLNELINQHGFTEQLATNYSRQIDHIWEHYNNHKRIFYQAETRWKDSEFWERRRE